MCGSQGLGGRPSGIQIRQFYWRRHPRANAGGCNSAIPAMRNCVKLGGEPQTCVGGTRFNIPFLFPNTSICSSLGMHINILLFLVSVAGVTQVFSTPSQFHLQVPATRMFSFNSPRNFSLKIFAFKHPMHANLRADFYTSRTCIQTHIIQLTARSTTHVTGRSQKRRKIAQVSMVLHTS